MGQSVSKRSITPEDGFSSGESVGKFVLPASQRSKKNIGLFNTSIVEQLSRRFGKDNIVEVTSNKTDENTTIEVLKVIPKKNATACVVYCRGNGEFMQDSQAIDELVADKIQKPDCGFIAINYRGVGGSSENKPTFYNHLVNDLVAVVEHAHKNNGLDYSQFILKGHSLGSAVATLAAAKLHENNKRVYLFNGRSFADINAVVAQRDEGSFHSSVASVTSVTGWNMQPGQAYVKIPDAYKTFITVENDSVIPYDASILKYYGDYLRANNKEDERQQLAVKHLLKPNYFDENNAPHNYALADIKRADGKNGNEVFYEFVDKMLKHRLLFTEVCDARNERPFVKS